MCCLPVWPKNKQAYKQTHGYKYTNKQAHRQNTGDIQLYWILFHKADGDNNKCNYGNWIECLKFEVGLLYKLACVMDMTSKWNIITVTLVL
jgi:hypothetical protein